MNLKIVTLFFILSLMHTKSFGNNTNGNDWWHFLSEKYHFNIEKNFDVYHEEKNGYSIIYLDLKFDTDVLDPQRHIIGKNKFDVSKDFVIKYEKKEISGDVTNYTNALLINKGENGHDACKANHISINKKTKKITANTCSFSKLFDGVSNDKGFSDKKPKPSSTK